MKKKFIVPVRYVIILFLLPAGACHKLIDWKDFYHQHKPGCRIERIIAKENFNEDPLVTLFSYNQKGDPESVIFSRASTGRPHLRFQYDQKGRLLRYFGPYSTDANTIYEFYSLYQYDNKGRIKVDTTYGMGDVVDGVPQPNQRFKNYTDYEYDAYDRVSRLTIISIVGGIPQPVWTEEFVYGPDGNLSIYRKIRDGVTEESHPGPYDNKTNINLTNKAWMFINRDYSRNNLYPATGYNKSQLPTGYNLPMSSLGFLYSYDISQSEIFYDCKK